MESKDKQILNIGLVSLFNDLSSEVITRVLPLYLLSVVHMSFVGIGFVEAIAEATATLGRLFSGYYSDGVNKRKPFIFIGYALSVVSRPMVLFQPTLLFISFARFFDKVGKSIRTPPRDALIADLSHAQNRGKNFGINRALDTLGAVIGLAAVYLFLQFNPMDDSRSLHAILTVACLVGVVGLIYLVFAVKEPAREKIVPAKSYKISLSDLKGDLKFYLVIAFFFALASSSDAFIIVRAKEIGFSTKTIFLMLASFNVVSASTAYSLTKLSDTRGRKLFLGLGWGIYALSYLIFGLSHVSKLLFFLTLLFYGLFYALTDGVEKALVADFDFGSKGYGWLGLVQGLAVIPANLVFAGLYQKWGGSLAFWSSSGLAVIGMTLLLFLKVKVPNESAVK